MKINPGPMEEDLSWSPSAKENLSLAFLDDPRVLVHIFYPRRDIGSNLEASNRSVVSFHMEDGTRVDGVMHMADKSSPNILFFHGNGETAYDYDDIGPVYGEMNINFCIVDFRGYGTSEGTPKYISMLKDAESIFRQYLALIKEKGFTGKVFVMGRSLGSASALKIASSHPEEVSGLILESGFAHTFNLLVNLGVNPRLLDGSKEHLISNQEMMKGAKMPVLVIHGEEDEIIPLEDGLDLYAAATNENKNMLVIPEAGHNTLMLYGLEEYMEAIKRFVEIPAF
jgi:alpha-beta hydrolase superfamily lysophospholipase